MSKLRVGSLFSGYGGLDLAVIDLLDAEMAWHCEWEEAPSKILEKHFPGVPNYRDVTKVDFLSIEKIDILTGGFPCQDLSLAGKRAGLKEGTRSGLWHEFARAIEEQQPKLVVIENVRGLLSAKAIELAEGLKPKFGFLIENPRGMLRKLPVVANLDRRTITYCQYGDDRMKPTDLWGNVPGWVAKDPCKNGDKCHVAAPRGSSTGTQGMKNAKLRSMIPYSLGQEILEAINKK